jgi:hypothetical protein
MITALPALTVSAIYLAWNVCHRERLRRHQLLCRRVAYMLWAAAHVGEPGFDEDDEPDNELERRLTTYTFFHRRHH